LSEDAPPEPDAALGAPLPGAGPAPAEGEAAPADEELFLETLRWLADATLLVHTVEETRVIPIAPRADDMWELGKLCSERMGLFQKVNRVARRHGERFEGRERDAGRHFLLGGARVLSWEEALTVEVIVGPYFRLFFESFLRASNVELAETAKVLWYESQPFIRFGQARIARSIETGGSTEPFQAAVDKWLPAAIGLLDEVPATLDRRWAEAGYREKPESALRSDYLEEMATYLNSTDLEVPESCLDVVPVSEVRWIGRDLGRAESGDRPLQAATFAFSQSQTGRKTASGDGPAPSAGNPGA
jgi:1,2-phenylacetyl-CoA epoxidase catalytic subunit